MARKPLRPELVDELLDKLGSDDDFRADFLRDPKAALLRLGAPQDFEWDCANPRRLVSKEEIRRTRAILRDLLLGDADHEWQCLESK
jgi:putative modified peptide